MFRDSTTRGRSSKEFPTSRSSSSRIATSCATRWSSASSARTRRTYRRGASLPERQFSIMPVEVIDESSPEAQAPAAGGASEPQSALGASAETIATAILECLGRAGAELSVALVGDERMRELNRDWR